MRFVWTDQGDDPSWGVGDKHGIDGYFCPLPSFDLLTPVVLDEASRRGHVQGIYLGHNWLPGKTPAQIAALVSKDYKRIGGAVRKLRVMLNLEEHDPEFIADTLEAWRDLHPYVPTSWSCEPMQGGWMHPEFVQRVLTCRVRVVPQAFWGSPPMAPVETDQVLRDITRRGFPENVVSLFYDAAVLRDRWDGYAFTMGRLPA